MLRALGALLLLGGALALGVVPSRELARRLAALEVWGEALALLERELAFSSPPMPELLAQLSRRSAFPVQEWASVVLNGLEELGERTFGEIWRRGLETTPGPLFPPELEALARLGEALGRYDRESQLESLRLTREELSRLAGETRKERQEKGKAWGALGLSLGAAVLILLL